MKKIAYISLNMAELEALMTRASFVEITMYLILKKLANFKTGQVGGFRQQKLNYEKLAQLLSRPTRGTAPAETIDRHQARGTVLRLEKIGLVSQISYVDESLKMRLHLSPMGDMGDLEEEAPEKPAPALAEPMKSHQEPIDRSSLMPADPEFWADDPFAISTDFLQYKQYDHLSHTDSTANNDKEEGTSSSVAVASNIHHQPILKKPEGMSAELTAAQMKEAMACEGFRLLDHEVSQGIMKSWGKMHLLESEFKAALIKTIFDGGDLVPGELDKVIRQMRKKSKPEVKASTGKGSVAL